MPADFIGWSTSWVETHRERLTSRGMTVTVRRSPDDGRDKSSVWMSLEDDRRIAEIGVWDTGEAEVELAEVGAGEVIARHKDLAGRADLERAFGELVSWMRA